MSYINKEQFKLITRRYPVTHLTPEQAIQELNRVADEANHKIAASESKALHWYEIASQLATENDQLKAQILELEDRVRRLEKRVKPKAGKNRQEWELEE